MYNIIVKKISDKRYMAYLKEDSRKFSISDGKYKAVGSLIRDCKIKDWQYNIIL